MVGPPRGRPLLASLALALLAPFGAPLASARADTVSMDDGREIEGTVVEETDKLVRVRVERGQGTALVELPREHVLLVQKGGPDPQKLRADARAALAQGDREGAIRILRRLCAEKPGDAGLRRDLAFAELLAEDLADARDDYARAVALDGTDVEALLGLGYVSRRSGERDTAISAYRSASRSGPRHAEAWRCLAELLLERDGPGDRDEAVGAARRALQAAPGDGRGALLAAEGLAKASGVGAREDHLAAVTLLETFAREHPQEALAARVVEKAASLAARLNELDRARGIVAAYVAKRPAVDEPTRARVLALESYYAWLAAGRPAPALGVDPTTDGLDREAAARRIAVALEIAPAEGELYLLRARLEARGGHLREGAADASRARELLPAGEARDDAGLVAAALERFAGEAERAAREAAAPAGPAPATPATPTTAPAPRELMSAGRHRRLADLLPFFPAVHEDLARALEAAGDLAGAKDSLEKARGRAPEADRERLGREIERVEQLRALQKRNKDL